MLVGVPKEIKDNEYRVGLVPSTVRELTAKSHQVLVERNAGLGAGLPDADYRGRRRRDRRRCRRGLRPRRIDRQGQGAAAGRAQEAPRRPDPVHLPASRARPGADRGSDGGGRLRDRLRDGDQPARHLAAAHPDVGGRRPHGAPCRRALPGEGERRARRAAGRRAGRAAGRCGHPRRRRRRQQRRLHQRRHGRHRHRHRPQPGGAAAARQSVRRRRAHRVLNPRRHRGVVPARRSGGRLGAAAGRGGAEADHAPRPSRR